jgi:hypothetical protein
MQSNRLEEYLDAVEQHLGRLPERERQEWREETRLHLLALVEAEEELGRSRSEAEEAAIRRFGDPEQVGSLLRPSYAGSRRRAAGERFVWTAFGLASSTGATFLAASLIALQYDYLRSIGGQPSPMACVGS